MKLFIRLFGSVKLAIFLIAVITISSIIGTLIPQHRSMQEYVSHYGQLAFLFQRLQLTKLYQSFWFLGLLFLLTLNIIFCTSFRLSPKLKKTFQPKVGIDEKKIKALKISDKFKISSTLVKSKERIKKEISSRRYRIKEEEKGNQTFLLARKKILGLYGSDIVHFGLLVILLGGIISGLGGLRKNIPLSEGQSASVPGADFKVKLEKFETEYYPDGKVKDWKSILTVLDNDSASLSKVIEVNHPLSYKGYAFYQHSYSWNWENPSLEIWIKKKNASHYLKKIEVKLGEKFTLSKENIQFSVTHFVPDFIIDSNNQVTSRSSQPNNPAAFIQGWEEGKSVFSGWIFARFPNFDRIHSSKETDLHFELKDFETDQISVIQAAKDPGVPFIWWGSSILMVGLILAFYWPHRKIRLLIQEKEEKTEVIAGGTSSKSVEAFKREFNDLMNRVRR